MAGNLRRRIEWFAGGTGIHGARNFWREEIRILKLGWLLIWLAIFFGLGRAINLTFREYAMDHIAYKVTREMPCTLPAVGFCPSSWMSEDKLNEYGITSESQKQYIQLSLGGRYYWDNIERVQLASKKDMEKFNFMNITFEYFAKQIAFSFQDIIDINVQETFPRYYAENLTKRLTVTTLGACYNIISNGCINRFDRQNLRLSLKILKPSSYYNALPNDTRDLWTFNDYNVPHPRRITLPYGKDYTIRLSENGLYARKSLKAIQCKETTEKNLKSLQMCLFEQVEQKCYKTGFKPMYYPGSDLKLDNVTSSYLPRACRLDWSITVKRLMEGKCLPACHVSVIRQEVVAGRDCSKLSFCKVDIMFADIESFWVLEGFDAMSTRALVAEVGGLFEVWIGASFLTFPKLVYLVLCWAFARR